MGTAYKRLIATLLACTLLLGAYPVHAEPEVHQDGWTQIANAETDGTDKWVYYENGALVTGWKQLDNAWYYFDGNGVKQTGWLRQGNTWYYLRDSGAMATGWHQWEDAWYYLHKSGAMAIGWLKQGDTWYYLQNSGAMQTGWLWWGNGWYYLKDNGSMATGITLVDPFGDSAHYYFGTSGSAIGVMQTNCWHSNSTEDSDGDTHTYWRYLGKDGKALEFGWWKINGVWHKFIPGGSWEREAKRKTGWLRDAKTGTWSFLIDGYPAYGWHTISGEDYYFRPYGNRRVAEGDLQNSELAKQHGPIAHYNNAPKGSKYIDIPTGGTMVTGWQRIQHNSYYDGPKQSWFYFESTGAMVGGWRKIDGKWYYFKPTGREEAGRRRWQAIYGQWFCWEPNGVMAQNEVLKISSDGHYITVKEGVDDSQFEGDYYTFDHNGVWVE